MFETVFRVEQTATSPEGSEKETTVFSWLINSD